VLEAMETGGVTALIPGHGPAAEDPLAAISLTRRYLAHLRETFAPAVEELMPFEEAYEMADWSELADLPGFDAANRRNAYQTYLSLEAEALAGNTHAAPPTASPAGHGEAGDDAVSDKAVGETPSAQAGEPHADATP
jgi:hypothetical protein